MLDIKRIRQNPQELRDALKARNKDISIDEFLAQDEKRRTLMAQVEEKKALRNAESKKIGEIKKRGGSAEEVAGIMEEMRKVGDEIAAFDADIAELEAAMDAFLMTLPNFPHESVPLGKDDHDNVEKRRWGTPREFGWTPKAHWDIGTDLGILDFDTAAKVSGGAFHAGPAFRQPPAHGHHHPCGRGPLRPSGPVRRCVHEPQMPAKL